MSINLDGGQQEDEGEHHHIPLKLQEVLHQQGEEVTTEVKPTTFL